MNKSIEIRFDKSIITSIKDLKSHIVAQLKLTERKQVKLIFKGKILEDTKPIEDYKIEKDDVLLYMVVDEVPAENDNLETNVSVASQDIRESLDSSSQARGFNRLREMGMSQQELHIFRMLFHAVYEAQHRNEAQSQSAEAYLQREEEWVNSQNNQQHPYVQRRNLLRNTRNLPSLSNRQDPNPNDANLRIRANNIAALDRILNRRIRRDDEMNTNESSVGYFFGFLLGFILSYFAILLLLLFTLKPKFKKGVQVGMIIGCYYHLTDSYNNTKHK